MTGPPSGSPDVSIRDVTPRDGLQAEAPIAVETRLALALDVAAAGVRDVEAASFVSAAAVPSMAGGADVFAALAPDGACTWWALVPNRRGAELALDAGARALTVTISASDHYSRANVGRSATEAIAGLAGVAAAIAERGGQGRVAVDVVVSFAFGSPYGDVAGPARVGDVVAAVVDVLDGARVTLADTTGTATPRRLADVLAVVPPAAGVDLGLHLHDTRGTALANALWALEHGVARFDTSIGGLGGSPFAPGAGGNLATEQLVMVLHDLGVRTSIDLDAILAVADRLPGLIGHPLPSRVAAAGPLPPFADR